MAGVQEEDAGDGRHVVIGFVVRLQVGFGHGEAVSACSILFIFPINIKDRLHPVSHLFAPLGISRVIGPPPPLKRRKRDVRT